MKVGILTFHASHNYGSMLQTYALQSVLQMQGCEVEIINFRSDVQKSLIPLPVSLCHPRSSLLRLLNEPTKTLALLSKYRKFEKFLRKDLNVTQELKTPADVAEFVCDLGYDAIITGSDQIWNPACWDFDMCYLADFDFAGMRIAYAPSLGAHPEEIGPSIRRDMAVALTRYSYLSTRELRGSNFVSDITGRNCSVVLDPTLLLDDKDYFAISDSSIHISEPYIFYYTPREKRGFFSKAKELAQKTGLKIVVTQDFDEYCGDNVITRLDCGPKEFLSIIRKATYCIGNSFHLMAFALIFKREFILLSNEEDSRMTNILKPLGLLDRLIIGNGDLPRLDTIDYTAIAPYIAALRSDSLSFLQQALASA